MFRVTPENRAQFAARFDVHSNGELSDQVIADTLLARNRLKELPAGSVVLAKSGKVRAEIWGASDFSEACDLAGKALRAEYRRHWWPIPQQDVVAAIGCAPAFGKQVLAGYGVDVIYAKERPPAIVCTVDSAKQYPGKEAQEVAEWLELRLGDGRRNLRRGMVFDRVDLLGPKPNT
jgi:hypothetical protein